MMSMLKSIVGVVLLCMERFKGPKTVTQIKRPHNSLGSLKGLTIRGYEIMIYCQRKEYRIKYKRWYIPDHTRCTYHVFSMVSRDAPQALRQACDFEVDLPGLIHRWNFESGMRKVHIRAYLDLLEQRMRANETS